MRKLRWATLLAVVALGSVVPSAAANSEPDCRDAEQTVEAGVKSWIHIYCGINGPMDFSVVDAPDHGEILEVVDGTGGYTFLYLADQSYSGTDSFTYSARLEADYAHNRVIERQVTLAVEPWHDDPPRCFGGFRWGRYHRGMPFRVERGGDLSLDLGCNEMDGQYLTFEIVGAGPRHGDVDGLHSDPFWVQGGGWYHHDGGTSRSDSVSIVVSDGTYKVGPFTWPIEVVDAPAG